MADGRDPGLPAVSSWRTVDLNSLGVHGHPQHWHVVLPADHRPYATDIGVVNIEGRPVAEAPDQALSGCRHQLAMLADVSAWHQVDDGTVESAAVAFDNTNDEVDLQLAS